MVVLTGGPGAGKTAVLEMARKSLCRHVVVLPESASIIFGGGFPRRPTDAARRAGQRAIYHVQRQLERLHLEEGDAAVLLCDRGTLDGLAYWPGPEADFFAELATDLAIEIARYHAVIHLRTPGPDEGYNHANPLRIEGPEEAAAIDARIEEVWRPHPRRVLIDATDDFPSKAARALAAIRGQLPACCSPGTVSPR